MQFKPDDWVIFDREVVQIKRLDSEGHGEVSDGWFCTSGWIGDRLRPLTLRNKRIAEAFDTYYKRLREIDGHAGFNFPDISNHFNRLALDAIDNVSTELNYHDLAQEFVEQAKEYKPQIQGVQLFRRA